jgi:hypothetical protein
MELLKIRQSKMSLVIRLLQICFFGYMGIRFSGDGYWILTFIAGILLLFFGVKVWWDMRYPLFELSDREFVYYAGFPVKALHLLFSDVQQVRKTGTSEIQFTLNDGTINNVRITEICKAERDRLYQFLSSHVRFC